MRRRSFLALGIAGAAAFAAAGWWASSIRSRAVGVDDATTIIVTAIVPSMLSGALPTKEPERTHAIRETVAGVGRAIAGLPPAARAEIGQLFALLALAPVRRTFAGVPSPWDAASEAEINAFLDAWHDSSWKLKRSAYDALHQLIYAAWYGNDRAWDAIDYPGPPLIWI